MGDIRLDLLGGFALRTSSGDAIPLSARKARAVLACLALSGERLLARDRLAALLWPDSPSDQARSSLRQALSAIRRALGPDALRAEGERLGLHGVIADVALFQAQLRLGGEPALQSAAELYRGDLLEGFEAGAPPFEQWLSIERERLRALAISALERLLDAQQSAGRTELAVSCATRLLAMDPLREPVHRTLMRLYQRQGRQAAALKQYRVCRGILQRELGVSPEADTDALYRQLLQTRRAAGATQHEEGPHSVTDQAGAARAVNEVDTDADAPAAMPARWPEGDLAQPSARATADSGGASPGPSAPTLRHAVVLMAEADPASAMPFEQPAAADRRAASKPAQGDAGGAAQDPERVHDALVRWRETAQAVALRCGGCVTDALGARLTIVFGVPVAHGNDAERALHAAVALHQALTAACRAGMPEQAGPPPRLAARIGVASGQVLWAGPDSSGRAGMTLTGAPVVVAARVMAQASPGETVVSNRVCLALPGRLEVAHRIDLAVPGIPELIPLWTVRRFLNATDTAPEHAFVGRQRELVQLAGVAGDCLRAGSGRVVVMRGEAGMGKSRLAERFVALAREHGMEAMRTLVLDFGVGRDSDPMRMLLADLVCGLPGPAGPGLRPPPAAIGSGAALRGDGPLTALSAKLDRAVADGRLREEDEPVAREALDLPCAPAHAAALGAMDAGTREQALQRCVVSVASARSRHKALLIVVEDVHWAERALLAVLARLAAVTRTHPLVLALTVRPEQDPLDSAWRAASGGASVTTIDLAPLDDADAHALAARYPRLAPSLVASCIRRAEGNPLFLDQLLRHAASDADADALPGSLQSIVLARLDRLPEGHRLALQAAAVLGQRFAPAALRHLLGSGEDPCDALVKEAMLRPEGDDYLFMHALIHEAIHASLLKSRRVSLHRRAADWYAARDPVLHAEHLDAAGDPAAMAAYEAAARHEGAHFRNERALRLVDRALQLAQSDADANVDMRQGLACLRGELLLDLGQPREAAAAFRLGVDLAREAAQRARSWFGVAASLRLLDRHEEALAALDHAERGAVAIGDADGLSRIESLRGNLHFPMGNLQACLTAHQRALRHATAVGSALGQARALGGLGDAYYQQGRMVTAREHFVRCVALAREGAFVRIEGANLPMIAAVDLFCDALPNAFDSCEAALRIARRIGDARIEVLALDVMASAAQLMGDWAACLQHADRGLAVARRLGARRFEAELLGRRALALARLGLDGDGEVDALLERAMMLSRATGVRYSGPMILGFLARASRNPARCRAAIAEGERILAQGCVSHCHLDLYEAAIELGLRSQDWPAVERAAAALASYTAQERFPWADFHLRRARLLCEVGRRQAAGQPLSMPQLEQLHALQAEAGQAGLLDAASRITEALRRARPAGPGGRIASGRPGMRPPAASTSEDRRGTAYRAVCRPLHRAAPGAIQSRRRTRP